MAQQPIFVEIKIMSDELEKDSDLTKETVHGVKNVWQRFGNWDEELVAEDPAPKPKPKPVPEPSCDMDEQLVIKMATWLRKKEGLAENHSAYMKKIKNDPKLYKELKGLKRW